MTYENEKTLRVSDEELMLDLENTSKEFKAYYMLKDGFTILRNLPENSSKQIKKYQIEIFKYQSLMADCNKFLTRLQGLAEERGLTWNE